MIVIFQQKMGLEVVEVVVVVVVVTVGCYCKSCNSICRKYC